MKKIDWSTVKDFAELAGSLVAYGLVTTASNKLVKNITADYIGKVGYNEAIKAIMDSSMYSHEKCKAVDILIRNGDDEYYKAIIHIVKDNYMYSHDKLKLIYGLSQD